MSKRLTSEWVDDISISHGEYGKKGQIGEQFVLAYFKSTNQETRYYDTNREKQLQGIDLAYKFKNKWYDVDVKNNMDQFGTFWVRGHWLLNNKSDYIFHVHPQTGWIAFYKVSDMISYYKLMVPPDEEFLKVTLKSLPSFVKKKRFIIK